MKVRAPWTPDQVVALKRWQERGDVHEFTCPGPDCRPARAREGADEAGGDMVIAPAPCPSRNLIPTPDGWVCACGRYRQDWAYAFMLVLPAMSITCPHCGTTSYNVNDVFMRYCGACHRFHHDDAHA